VHFCCVAAKKKHVFLRFIAMENCSIVTTIELTQLYPVICCRQKMDYRLTL